jgi:hypothetical protein
MQPVGLVASRYRVVRDEIWSQGIPPDLRLRIARQVAGIRLFEEPPSVLWRAMRTVVLNGK